jgi:hypothetical protein
MVQNGGILLRFYRPSLNNPKCNEPNLNLKILQPNGTLTPFIVKDFSPPTFNFCRLDDRPTSPDYIQISRLKGESFNLYLFYYNISDTNRELPFGRFVAQVNMTGDIIRYKILL